MSGFRGMRLRCINAVGLACGFSPEEPYGFLQGILAGALICRNNWLLSGSSTQMMSVSAAFRPANYHEWRHSSLLRSRVWGCACPGMCPTFL